MAPEAAYFRGYVRYADIFDNVFIVGFCFVFDPKRNRWVLRGNKAHNYWRKEKKSSAILPDWLQPDADPHSVRSAINSAAMTAE